MMRLMAAAAVVVLSAGCAYAEDASAIMPFAKQNAVVHEYCGSCHSDALMYGGMSVEHFDAAHADPSLAAMLVSKLTSGLTPGHVLAASRESDAKVMSLLHGAMGAAGTGVPDEPTQIALGKALSMEAAGAEEWHAQWIDKPARTFSAAILRQVTSTKFAGKIDMYRLILSCRVESHEGEIRLAWANGVPEEGQPITVAVDGRAPFTHKAEGGAKQGNGKYGPGATVLYPDTVGAMTMPERSLRVSELYPGETVEFPFAGLSARERTELAGCFGRKDTARLHLSPRSALPATGLPTHSPL